jgi:hypothetical protein
MCVNCLSNAEVAVANVAITAAFVKGPAHRLLADMGLVEAPDPVKRDVRTVSFLRRLELDPVEVLGRDAVDAAEPLGAGRAAADLAWACAWGSIKA